MSNPLKQIEINNVIYEIPESGLTEAELKEKSLVSAISADTSEYYAVNYLIGIGNGGDEVRPEVIRLDATTLATARDLTDKIAINKKYIDDELAKLPVAAGTGTNSLLGGNLTTNTAISENVVSFGTGNIGGLKGYYWSSIDITNKKITLTKSYTDKTPVKCNYAIGDKISIVNTYRHDECSTITGFESTNGVQNIVIVDSIPFTTVATDYEESAWSRFCIYCPEKANIGLADLGRDVFIAGNSNKGGNWCSFVAGYKNNAIGQYGVVVGNQNKGGYASFVYGRENNGVGQYAFTGGQSNKNNGRHCAVFGYNNQCFGTDESKIKRNLVSGEGNKESGSWNFVSGYTNTSSGTCSGIIGWNNTNSSDYNMLTGEGNTNSGGGKYNIISGYHHTVSGNEQAVFGYQNTVEGGECNLVSGYTNTSTNGRYNLLQGYLSSIVYGDYGLVVGISNKVQGTSDSHGRFNILLGEGNISDDLYTFAFGYKNTVNGRNTIAFGASNNISVENGGSNYAAAIGVNNTITHSDNIVLGNHLTSNDTNQLLLGQYNKKYATAARITGWGTSSAAENIETLDTSGNLRLAGSLTLNCNGTSHTLTADTIYKTTPEVINNSSVSTIVVGSPGVYVCTIKRSDIPNARYSAVLCINSTSYSNNAFINFADGKVINVAFSSTGKTITPTMIGDDSITCTLEKCVRIQRFD